MKNNTVSYTKLMYIIHSKCKVVNIIKTFEKYGAINVENLSGLDEGLYYIDVDNTICFFKRYSWILPVLKLAGYKNITSELEIAEYNRGNCQTS